MVPLLLELTFTMHRLVLPCFLAFVLALSACQKAVVPESPAALKARIDSSVKAQLPALRQKAAEDLDKRSAIEVKAKTDSIVQATLHPKKIDTTHKVPVMDAQRRRRALQELHMLDSNHREENLLR